MKAIFCLILFCLLSGAVSAQDDWRADRKLRFPHQVGIGWGFRPANGIVKQNDRPYYERTSNTGAVSVYYFYRFTKVVSFGGAYSFAGVNGKSLVPGDGTMTWRERNHTLLPVMNIHWLNKRWGGVYSRVGAGVRFQDRKRVFPLAGERGKVLTCFAFHLSPVGVEVEAGSRWAGFAEIGIGTLGTVIVGGRYRFR